MSDDNTRKREIRALIAAMQETGVSTATIITLQDEEQLATDAGQIDVTPAWRWLLNSPVS